MQEFTVNLFESKDKGFLISYVNPLTKRKIRHCFPLISEAKDFKKTIETRYKKMSTESYSKLTIEDLIIHFLQEKPENPFSKSNCHLIDFIDTFGKFYINDITTSSIKTWLDQVQLENNLRPLTVRHIKCDLDAFFVFLEEKDIISESPSKNIYYKKTPLLLKSRNLLTEKEVENLLSTIKAYSPGYLYPMIKLIAETGAKPSEVVDLKWSEVDLYEEQVTLRSRAKNQSRTVKISSELVKCLNLKKKNSDHVFNTFYKEPFTLVKLTRLINEFRYAKLYLGEWCPSDLRHSLAVNFIAKGGDFPELQRILGHYDIFETKRLYCEETNKRINKDIINPFE